eukprot:1016706-Rhodomonas_salina.2
MRCAVLRARYGATSRAPSTYALSSMVLQHVVICSFAVRGTESALWAYSTWSSAKSSTASLPLSLIHI